MNTFHDVEIYSGTVLATTGSRLEIGANNKFLLEIFSGLINCARCKEPLALIFPEEEESTLREVFKRLSHFKSGLSIIENPSKVNSLLDRLSLTVSSEVSGTRLRDQFSLTSDGGKKEEKQVDTETSESKSEPRIVQICSEEKEKHHEASRDVKVEEVSAPLTKRTVYKNLNTKTKRDGKGKKALPQSVSKFDCGLCEDRSFKRRNDLYRHYCLSHYKDQLRQFIEEERDRCKLCNVVLQSQPNLIRHVGVSHGKVDSFLPPHLRISGVKIEDPKERKKQNREKRKERKTEEKDLKDLNAQLLKEMGWDSSDSD